MGTQEVQERGFLLGVSLPPFLCNPQLNQAPGRAWLHHLLESGVAFISQEVSSPPASLYALWPAALAPSTRRQYAWALAAFGKWLGASPATGSAITLLSNYLSYCVATHLWDRPHVLGAALQFLAKCGQGVLWPWELFHLTHRSLSRLRPLRQRNWISLAQLEAALEFSPATASAYFAIWLGFVYLLRVSELGHLNLLSFTGSAICISPAKSRKAMVWRSCSVFFRQWFSYLLLQHQGPAPFYLDARQIAAFFTTTFGCSWHALRRGGAATLHHLGASIPAIH